MDVLNIQLWLIVISVPCALWALGRLREERQAWKECKEAEALLSGWFKSHERTIKEQKETIHDLSHKLVDISNNHNEWLEGAKANCKKLKKEIASLKGQNTRLKKKLEALSGK